MALRGIRRGGLNPVLRIPDGTSLSRLNLGEVDSASFPDFPEILGEAYGLLGWRSFDNTKEFNNIAAGNYCAELSDIDIAIGQNPGVFAIYGAGAQACLFRSFKIWVEGGLAGMCDVPGSGAKTMNFEIEGGDYAVIQRDYRPTPSLNNGYMHGQTKAGIYNLGERNAIICNGCRFEGSAPDYKAIHTPQTIDTISGGTDTLNNGENFASTNAVLFCCNVELTGDAADNTALDGYDSNFLILDSHIKAGEIARTGRRNSPEVALAGTAGQWMHVESWRTAMKSSKGLIYVDGTTVDPATENKASGTTPTGPSTPHGIDWLARVFGMRDQDIARPLSEPSKWVWYDGVPDTPTFDHGPPLMALAQRCKTPGDAHFGKGVVIPKGFFDSQTEIDWPAPVPITGICQRLAVLQASTEWQPTSRVDLFRTAATEDQTTLIQNLAFNVFEAKDGLSTGGAITQSDLHAHQYITALHIRGHVRTLGLQPMRHEFYGSGNTPSLQQEPLVEFSDKASGVVHTMPLDIIDARSENPADYYGVILRNGTAARRLIVFDMNVEGQGGGAQIKIEHFDNVVFSPLKAELGVGVEIKGEANIDERLLEVINSRGLIITAISGNMPVQDLDQDAVISLDNGCEGVLIGMFDRTKNEDPLKDMIEVTA